MSYGVWIIIETLIEGISVPGWATLAAGMTLLGGIQLLCIGILGEYIGRIYAEVKNRPKYIVSEEYSHHQPKSLLQDKQNNVASL
jgi:glycosyltransferase involved in cell wall biosynthesis